MTNKTSPKRKVVITCFFILGVVMKRVLLFSLFATFTSVAADFTVTSQKISDGNRFQAISIDEKGGLWVSGTQSAVYHSDDDGKSWDKINTPSTNKPLQFRDIQVINNTIVLMSAGEGADSKLYMSNNNGASWTLTNQGGNPSTFYDCFSMTDEQTGWLYGDSIDGNFFLLKTTNGAKKWQAITLPFAAQTGEGGFASSGTCLNHNTNGDIAIGTGNTEIPRLLIKPKSQSWQIIDSPYTGGEAAGIFSVQFDEDTLYTFGGSLKTKAQAASGFTFSLSKSTWAAMPKLPLKGAVYGSAVVENYVFITNPQGIAVLEKNKKTWRMLSNLDVWAMACKESQCWGVGADDVVVNISW